MLSDFNLAEIRRLSDKVSKGRRLTAAERDFYDDIQEDGDAVCAFNLYGMLSDTLAHDPVQGAQGLPAQSRLENQEQLQQELKVAQKIKI